MSALIVPKTLHDFNVFKKILNAGTDEHSNYPEGSKMTFHFQTIRLKENGEISNVIDDSEKIGQPMELILGKKFKMPVWEECLKSMAVHEVSEFTIKKKFVDAYPLVSKSYREYAGVAKSSKNLCCGGMLAFSEGFGHKDLAEIIREPSDLLFKIKLTKVERPGEYEKESWSMEPEEKFQSISVLKEDGNKLYNEQHYKEAEKKYAEALGRIEQLLLREKPGEEEWLALEKLKIPILLNYSQCKLINKEYYSVIEYTTVVLEKDPNNVKALFRRAKAYAATWDFDLAYKDFQRVAELDPSFKSTITKELKNLGEMQSIKDADLKAKLYGKIF